jgi:hypothetical protein
MRGVYVTQICFHVMVRLNKFLSKIKVTFTPLTVEDFKRSTVSID